MNQYQRLSAYIQCHPVTDEPGALVRCPTCRADLQPQEFYLTRARRLLRDTGSLRGAKTRCRTCVSKAAASSQRLLARKQIVVEAKKSGCVDCGLVLIDYPEVFEFDHVEPGKIKSVALWMTSGSEDDLRKEIARCEVVCANCHRIRTATRPHGGRYSDHKENAHVGN